MLFPYRDVYPKISKDVFIAPNSAVIGDVVIGSESSVWFGTVIRGDVMPIRIGERTNLQDGTIVHVTGGEYEVFIGDDVLIGHRAIIHGATLKDKCFVGMAATVLDGAIIETGGIVAAGALVTPGKIVKEGELWAGSPAKLFRTVSQQEVSEFLSGAEGYRKLAQEYRAALD